MFVLKSLVGLEHEARLSNMQGISDEIRDSVAKVLLLSRMVIWRPCGNLWPFTYDSYDLWILGVFQMPHVPISESCHFWCQACCFVHQEVINTSAIFEDRLRREARSCKESILYLAKAHGPRSAHHMIHEIQVLQLSKALKMPHRLFAVPHLCHEEKSWRSIRISRATDLGDGWIFGENQSISVYARRDRYLWLTCWEFLCGTCW